MTRSTRKLKINLPQVAGGALAAVSAAAIASFLGVGGTVIGAALGSVVASVGGAFYSHSFRRAGEQLSQTRVLTVVARARPGASDVGPADLPEIADDVPSVGPDAPTGGLSAPARPVDDPDPGRTYDAVAGPVTDSADGDEPARGARDWRQLPWKRIAVVAAVLFVLAIVVIEGIEVLIGHPISGGSGTTVTKLFNDHKTTHRPAPTPTPTSTPTSTSTVTSTPSSTPTATVTVTATPTGTATVTTTPTSPPASSDTTTGAAGGAGAGASSPAGAGAAGAAN